MLYIRVYDSLGNLGDVRVLKELLAALPRRVGRLWNFSDTKIAVVVALPTIYTELAMSATSKENNHYVSLI